MALDFLAIDFETANFHRSSPCSVGIAIVRNGEVVDSIEELIHQELFDPFNVSIHGITPRDVVDARPFPIVWDWLNRQIGDLPLVAHNASFDTGVIRDALSDAMLPWPSLTYACTLVMGRQTYDLPSYRLPYVAEAAGLKYDPKLHHKAVHDATLSAQIMLDIAKRHETDDLEILANSIGLKLGRISLGNWEGCKSKSHKARSGFGLSANEISINQDADPDNPIYGAGVTFTGALSGMTRALAWEYVAECGGVPLDGVTKKTNLLVFGYQDARMLTPGAELSSKYRKALELRDKGADIEIIGEDDFLNMLQEAEIVIRT